MTSTAPPSSPSNSRGRSSARPPSRAAWPISEAPATAYSTPWRLARRPGSRPTDAHPLDETDQVAGRIRELCNRRTSGHIHRRHDGLAAPTLRVVKGSLEVGDLHVPGEMLVAIGRGADATGDAPFGRLDHPVVHGVVGVDLPPEERRVERLKRSGVRTCDLEVNDRVCHVCLLVQW